MREVIASTKPGAIQMVSEGNNAKNFEQLIRFEAVLQRLWYKLHLYADAMESFIDRIDSIDVQAARREIIKTKMQYAQYCKLNPTGATHLNDLKSALIRTSKLRELYDDFVFRASFLDELESLL